VSGQKKTTREEVIAAMQSVAVDGVARSSEWWRRNRSPARPASRVIFQLFGSWDNACLASGLVPPREAKARELAERAAAKERSRAERAEAARLAAEHRAASAREAAAEREKRAAERLQRAAERDARVREKRERAQAQARAARPGHESRQSARARERSEQRREQMLEDIQAGTLRIRTATEAERQQWSAEKEARAQRYVPGEEELRVPGSRVKRPAPAVDDDTAQETAA